MQRITRRQFLAISARLAAALTFIRWFRIQPARVVAASDLPHVCVAEGSDEDTPAQILETALKGLGGIERFVKPGQVVAIKPNATWAYPPRTASSTDPEFLTAVIQAVKDAGAGRIIVMDHCSIEPGADEALRISGIGRVVKDAGVEAIFPDRFNAPKSVYTKIDLPYGRANQKIGVIKAAAEADVRINLAVAKTHNVTKFTMCLKHMMGFLQQPGLLHANLEQGIADLSTPSAIQAQLHILEAIRVRIPYGNYRVCAGPETDITHPHVVTRRNTIVAGVDPVLIDAYGCMHFFNIQPQELTHLLRAYESGCGEIDVETALTDGRVRVFKVGASLPAESESVSTSEGETPESPAPQPTAVYAPGPEVSIPLAPSTGSEAECRPAETIIAPSPLLKTALIPVAAIISGLGLAILNRMRRKLPPAQAQDDEKTIAGSASQTE